MHSDFVRDAAEARHFTIRVAHEDNRGERVDIPVRVPSFKERSSFLRRRLRAVSSEIREMLSVKEQADVDAERGAKRFAIGGFVALSAYWVLVYWLTFTEGSPGWDVMECVREKPFGTIADDDQTRDLCGRARGPLPAESTDLVGLTGAMGVYLLALYLRRDLNYSAAFHMTMSRRRAALYTARGFSLERWRGASDRFARRR